MLRPGSADAQYVAPNNRPATSAELIGGNMLIGGLTAATRAMFEGEDPFKAFAVGSLGGAVVLGGKYLASRHGSAYGWAGLALSGTGTSIVSNAGRGVSPLHEITLPLPGLRVRLTPSAERKVRVVMNAYETVLVAEFLMRDGLAIDWSRSAFSGALVFVTEARHVELAGTRVNGAAVGPVAIVSEFSNDPPVTARHEVVHVLQGWFVQEAWGRPIEDYVRARMPFGDRIPAWFEFGIAAPGLYTLEHWLVGRNGTHHLMEAEAGLIARR